MTQEQSPFDRRAYAYIERGYSVVPIAPGTKRPGQWSQSDGWRGMHDWERFNQRLPTEIELEHWDKWPDAGIGLLTGQLSGVVALDRDYDAPGTDALERLIPYTPVKKKGAKGYTAFFRYNGEKSCSFNIGGARVLDVLSDGRQTLMPGTKHPEGHTYIYLTEDLLEDYDPKDLPALPDDFLEQVARTLEPYQTQEDKKYQKKNVVPADHAGPINTDLSIQAEYFRDLNGQALLRLDEWVTRIVPLTKPERDGFRTVATWRGAKNPNVGVHHSGIFDFGGNYGMTPIDLVMYANGLTFQKAAEALRACLALNEPEPISMTVGGAGSPSASPAAVQSPGVPLVMPWLKPQAVHAPPPPVMLPPSTSLDSAPALPEFIQNPPGVLGDIARWITATAPKAQPELSLAAAIALCSVVMARTYRTVNGNYTSLYLIMVAKSGEGKEHPQSCVEKVLVEAGLAKLYAGSGYTSAGAVHSALLKSPAHVVAIDEIGKLLKLSRKNGQAHSEAAIDKLVEAFGRCDGVMHPPVYSSMTLSKGATTQTERVVHNPGITMLGATTPGTFYAGLSTDLVKDGFLGRCIVVESKQPRQLTQLVPRTTPPEKIVEWCREVHVTGSAQGNLAGQLSAEQPPQLIEMSMDEACMDEYRKYEIELMEAKDKADGDDLDMLLVRTLEKALRLALVVAKARDKNTLKVTVDDLRWAYQYVAYYDMALVRAVVDERTENEHDANMKKLVQFVKSAKKYSRDKKFADAVHAGGMPRNKLQALMKGLNSRQVNDLIDTAVEAGFIKRSPGIPWGLACEVYFPEDGGE